MLQWLTAYVGGTPWTYPLICALAVADIIGVVPAETVIVTATLLARKGQLLIPGVAAAAILGALIGDNILYAVGSRVGDPLARRFFRSRSSQRRLQWAQAQMRRHGNMIIVAGRFVPGGRTAVMFAAGLLAVPWPKFIAADVAAVLVWAGYWVGVTVVLGDIFSGRAWLAIMASLGVAAVLGGVAEVFRRYGERQRKGQRREVS